MDLTRLLAGSAVLGLVAGFWGKIKVIAWKVFNLFVEQVELIDETTTATVIGYLVKNQRRSRLYEKTYGAAYEHSADGKYGLVPYEMFGKRDMIFWNGWFPFLFSMSTGAAAAQGTAGNTNTQARPSAKITFVRHTVCVEEVINAACDERNALSWNVDHSSKQSIRRFFIRHVPAINASKANAAGGGTAGLAWYQLNNYRLLKHTPDQLGKRTTSSKRPLDDLIFPERVKRLIEEVRLWRNSRDWYQERQIPWKRGWLCYSPPGTGKTALARAFAEELDMPLFVYNLAEIGNHELMQAWSEMQANIPCVALIEDIDNVFHGRENVVKRGFGSLFLPRKKKGKNDDDEDELRSPGMLSFDTLLNCLDGVERADGVFTVITTNDIGKIDPALGQPRTLPDGTTEFISTRPGRIDKAVELTYMETVDKKRMARRILGEYEEAYLNMLDFVGRYPELQETPAQFQERCAQIALACFWKDRVVGEAETVVEEVVYSAQE